MKIYSRLTLLLCATLLTAMHGFGQVVGRIDSVVRAVMKQQKAVGVSVGVIKSGEIIHLNGYGYRDLEAKLDATIQTPFLIASIGKPIVNAAVFRQVENGRVKLDNDINNYLPFKIINPHVPNRPITIDLLLNHKAGINDMNGMKFWTFDGDSKIDMGEFLRDYLTVDGKLYHEKRFDTTSYRYSNVGYALLALIVEHTSGQSFDSFCKENIFSPLSMTNTSWFLRDLDISTVAKTYTAKNKFRGFMGFPFYPAGQLRTSISDYTKFIKGYLSTDDSFILSRDTREIITPKPGSPKSKYYTWEDSTYLDKPYYVHGGGLPGVRTIVLMNVIERNAIVFFANSEIDPSEVLKFIDNKILHE